MGALRALVGSGRRNAGSLGRGLLGFVGTLIVWSVLVGDWTSSSTTTDTVEVQHTLSSPSSVSSAPVWPGWAKIEHVILFGDSSSSTSFDYKGTRPSPQNPWGNHDAPSAQPQGASPRWIQYLHSAYNASAFQVTNLAMPDATVEPHYWAPRPQGQAPRPEKNSLKETVSIFRGSESVARSPPFGGWDGEHALFALWFGATEVVASSHKGQRLPLDAILATYTASFERLHALGARNFLILNVPPVDLSLPSPPPGLSNPSADIDSLNARLAQLAARVRSRHTDSTVFHFDAHALYTHTLANPSTSPLTAGLKETTTFCEGYSLGAASLTELTPGCAYARDEYFWEAEGAASHVVMRLVAERVVKDCFGEGVQGFCEA